MANTTEFSKAQLVYLLCLPLAVLLGYFLSEPTGTGSVLVVTLLFGLLTIPLILKWYHPLLIGAWNAAIAPYFLPGRPQLWMILAFIGLIVAVVNRSVDEDKKFLYVPGLTWALVAMAGVVVITANLTGGFGLRALGSERVGGKAYYYIFAALFGYFALTSQQIPKDRAKVYVALFFLSGLTALVSNIAFAAGPSFVFLYYLFPPDLAVEQAAGEFGMGFAIVRLVGLTAASTALFCWMLAKYGIKGSLDYGRPFRLILFILAWLGCIFCGFRSVLILFVLLFTIQFCLERLYRTALLPIIAGVAILAAALVLPNADKLPLVVQRTLSFLPVKVNYLARQSAEASLEWRLDMWKQVLPEVPKHLLLGKGLAIDPNELDISMMRGLANTLQQAILAGDYHNGPLSLIIPFGIWGALAFAWFIIALLRYLYKHYKHGDPDLRGVNTLLLAFCLAKLVFFLCFFGGFYMDFCTFVGIAGFSVSLNGAERKAASGVEPLATQEPSPLWYMIQARRDERR